MADFNDSEECKGCGRSRTSAAEEPVDQCDFAFNRTPGRCFWLAMQPVPKAAEGKPAPPVDATPGEATAAIDAEVDDDTDDAGTGAVDPAPRSDRTDATATQAQLAALTQQLAEAQASAALARRQLTTEATERASAEKQAVEHGAAAAEATRRHGLLQQEADRLRQVVQELRTTVEKSVGPPGAATDGAPGAATTRLSAGTLVKDLDVAVGAARWLTAARLKLGGLTAAIGLLLGAGGMSLWHHASSDPPADKSPVVASPTQAAPGASTVAASPTASAPAATSDKPVVTEGVVPTGPATPKPPAPAAPAPATALTAAVLEARLKSALAMEKLRVAVRVSTAMNEVQVDSETLGAAQRTRTSDVIRTVFTGAGLPAPTIEQNIATSAPAAAPPPTATGPRPPEVKAAAETPDRQPVKPVIAAPPSARPQSFVAACDEKLAMSHLNPLYSYKLSSCMHDACCRTGLSQNAECREFDARMKLNCPGN